jgi:hypothetical protein
MLESFAANRGLTAEIFLYRALLRSITLTFWPDIFSTNP